jgi:hypothetical protein
MDGPLSESAMARPGPGRATLGRIVSWGVAGVDPDIMGIGSVLASGCRSSCPPGDIAHEVAVPLLGRGRR